MNVDGINVNSASFKGTEAVAKTPFDAFNAPAPKPAENKGDSVELSTQKEPPKIGFFRLAFRRLTKEQVKQINETGMLPKNAKFRRNAMANAGYSYTIQNKEQESCLKDMK